MKKKVKKLFKDFPNLIEILIKLRNDEELSYQKISDHFGVLGYECSKSMIERLYTKYNIKSKRSRVGKNNSFYNKKHTDRMKLYLSKRAMDSGKSKGKNNPMFGKSGILSPAWKGGKSKRQMLFYSSPEWEEKRLEIMKTDNFTCLKCNKNGSKIHAGFNVHHIIPLSVDWEQRLENNNLITLCVSCHKETFGKEQEMIILFQDIVRTHGRP